MNTEDKEANDNLVDAASNFFSLFFEHIGEDISREGLADTQGRFLKGAELLFRGYKMDPAETLNSVLTGVDHDDMVILKDVGFYSMCEHHLLPFFGNLSIGYVPDKKLAGLSSLANCVDVFARRLQIQENLTAQIADAIMEGLRPKGVMVVCRATHLCISMMSANKENAEVSTSATRGLFKTDQKAKMEFMQLIKR